MELNARKYDLEVYPLYPTALEQMFSVGMNALKNMHQYICFSIQPQKKSIIVQMKSIKVCEFDILWHRNAISCILKK